MNKIDATLSDIQSIDNLAIVTFQTKNQQMRMMSLGIDSSISIGSKVTLGVKASSIALAKDLNGLISLSNQLQCVVKSVKNGVLLSSIILTMDNFTIESIITRDSSIKMDLKSGDEVIALIKSSELSILQLNERVADE